MAPAVVRGLRRWASERMQPLYDQLPTSEQAADEAKEDAGLELGSSDSSPRRSSSGFFTFGGGEAKAGGSSGSGGSGLAGLGNAAYGVLALPLLAARFAYLCWLLATEPVRRHTRQLGAGWAGLYAQLGSFQVLVPSFWQPGPGPAAPRRLHPTAWLDGLRGVAAFFVVWHHASLLWFAWPIHNGYASSPDARWLIQLPVVRLAVSGLPHVCVFFVISGYALSYKPLRLARQGRFGAAGEAIGSAVFRRHTRLFLLPTVVVFSAALLTHWDLYGTAGWGGVAIPSRRPPRADTLAEQLHHWAQSMISLTNPLSKNLARGGKFVYDPNLWTLPVEFDCSLMLFLCHAAFTRFRPRMRLLFMLAILTFAMRYIYWQAFLFFCGMVICDLHFEFDGIGGAPAPVPETMASSQDGPGQSAAAAAPPPPRPWYRQPRMLLGLAAFAASLYVLSIPEAGRGVETTPGYRTLYAWTPAYHMANGKLDYFWIPLAAVFVVLVLDRMPPLQRLFTHPLSQYLGRISYSMYLVHGGLIWTVGHWAARRGTALTGTATQWQYGAGIALSAAATWAATIYLADLATRTLDAKAVALGHAVYRRCVLPDVPEPPALPRAER